MIESWIVRWATALALAACAAAAAADGNAAWRTSVGYVHLDLSAGGELRGITGSGIAPGDDGSAMLSVLYQPGPRWGVEVLLAPPFEHTLTGTGSLAGLGAVVSLESVPITVQARRLFRSPARAARPFVGVGLTYAHFADETPTASLARLTGPGARVELDGDLAPIVSTGLEVALTGRWSLELAAGYVEPRPEIRVSGPALVVSGETALRTIVYTTQIGYRF